MKRFVFLSILSLAFSSPSWAQKCSDEKTKAQDDAEGLGKLGEPEKKKEEAEKKKTEATTKNAEGEANDGAGASQNTSNSSQESQKTRGAQAKQMYEAAQKAFDEAAKDHGKCVKKAQEGLEKAKEAKKKVEEIEKEYASCDQTPGKAKELKTKIEKLIEELEALEKKCSQDKQNSEKQAKDAGQGQQNKQPQEGKPPEQKKPEEKEKEEEQEKKAKKTCAEQKKVPVFNPDGSVKKSTAQDNALDTPSFSSQAECQEKPSSFVSPKDPAKTLTNPSDYCKDRPDLKNGKPVLIDEKKAADTGNTKIGADGNPLCSGEAAKPGLPDMGTEDDKLMPGTDGTNNGDKPATSDGKGGGPTSGQRSADGGINMTGGGGGGGTPSGDARKLGEGASMKGSGGGVSVPDEGAPASGYAIGVSASAAKLPSLPSGGILSFSISDKCKPPVYMSYQYTAEWCRSSDYNRLLSGVNFNNTMDAAESRGCRLVNSQVVDAIAKAFKAQLGPKSPFCKKIKDAQDIINGQ